MFTYIAKTTQRFFVVIFLMIIAFSCQTTRVTPERPDAEVSKKKHTPQISSVNLPVYLSINRLEKTINEQVKGILYEDMSFTNNDNDDLKVRITKIKRINISAVGNALYISVPLRVWARPRKVILGMELSKSTEFEAIMQFRSELSLDAFWNFETSTTYHGHDWLKTPVISLGPIDIPITTLVGKILENEMPAIARSLDGEIEDAVDSRKQMEELWTYLQEPLLLDESYDAWLKLTPAAFRLGPIKGDKERILLNLGMKSVVEVSMGEKPDYEINPLLPRLEQGESDENAFHMSLSTRISYGKATQVLRENLIGYEYEYKKGKKQIVITDVRLYGNGDELVIELDFTGDVEGNVFMTGIPVYNAENKAIEVADFDFDVKSKKALLSAADWLLHGIFRKKIENALTIPIGDQLDNINDMINDSFKNNELVSGLFFDCYIDDIVPRDILLKDESLETIIKIDGRAFLRYGN